MSKKIFRVRLNATERTFMSVPVDETVHLPKGTCIINAVYSRGAVHLITLVDINEIKGAYVPHCFTVFGDNDVA